MSIYTISPYKCVINVIFRVGLSMIFDDSDCELDISNKIGYLGSYFIYIEVN